MWVIGEKSCDTSNILDLKSPEGKNKEKKKNYFSLFSWQVKYHWEKETDCKRHYGLCCLSVNMQENMQVARKYACAVDMQEKNPDK